MAEPSTCLIDDFGPLPVVRPDSPAGVGDVVGAAILVRPSRSPDRVARSGTAEAIGCGVRFPRRTRQDHRSA